MYGPQPHQEIVRQRHLDLLRRAEKERLAHLARGEISGRSGLERVRYLAAGLSETVRAQLRRRGVREPVVDASA